MSWTAAHAGAAGVRGPDGIAPTTVLPRPRALRYGLEFDDGSCLVVRGRGLIGRDPTAPGREQPAYMVMLADHSCSISRTHLEFWIGNGRLWIRDCHSLNGSELEIRGRRTRIPPGTAVPVPPASVIRIGGQRIRVRSIDNRAVIDALTVEWGSASRAGARRAHNQDSFGARPPVFVVADGIGSHSAGDLASREVVQALLAVGGHREVTDAMLNNAVANARDRIGRIPVQDGKRRPGTTISGTIITHCNGVPCWMVVNLGDSRTYRLDATGLRQITRDHSVGQKLVDAGVAARGGPAQLPVGNILTRAVIGGSEHLPDVWRLPVNVGDRMLVCSDGLSSIVDGPNIERVLRTVRDPQAAVDALIDAAIRAGGSDDVTAVVVDAVAIRPRHYSDMSTRAVRRGEFARDGTRGRLATDRSILSTRSRWRGW